MYLTVWFRVMLLVKLMRGFSDVYRKRQDIVEACISHGQPVPIFDWEFILKSIFIVRPVVILLFLSAINIFTFGHMMYVGERECATTNFSFIDSVWLAIVTLTTLGYGDLTPKTAVGRCGSFFSCLMGIVITSIVVAVLTNLMIPAS